MTIKHTGKNISAESENVITDVTFNEATGVLTFYQKNFYDGSTTSFSRDLSGVQLGVVKLADQNALNTLKNDSTKEDYKKTHLFLVPLSGNNTEGVFAEYVYVETSTDVWDFERLGSTELNLSNYIQKSQTNGLIKNDGTINTNNYDTASSIQTKKNDLTNDSGFLTSHQSLTNYIQKSQTSGLVKNDGTIDRTNYLSSLPSHNHDDRYYTETEIDTALNGKANSSHLHSISDINNLSIPTKTSDLTNDSGFLTSLPSHNHDDRYYTETEIDTALSEKANAVHNHTSNDITDMDTVTITVTYTDNTTDNLTLTLFKQTSSS